MNENAKAWLRALRSGEYTQGESWLRKGDNYCCLGVACDLYAKNASFEVGKHEDDVYSYNGESEVLTPDVRNWLGIYSDIGNSVGLPDGECLTSLNDGGYTFHEIANLIEKYQHSIFQKEER